MNHGLGKKILHRKTEWIKFNGTKIISGKLANKYEVFDDMAPRDDGHGESVGNIFSARPRGWVFR